MTLHRIARAAGSVATALTLAAATAAAQPITFTFSGIGSGSYNAVTFTSQPFTVTLPANLSTSAYAGGAIPQFSGLTGTITIGGGVLTNGTFDTPLRIFVSQANQALGFGRSEGSGIDLLDLFFNGTPTGTLLATYDLRSSFGPATSTAVTAVTQFTNRPVNGAPLTFTSVSTATFQAVGPTVLATPEPATLALVGGGLLLVGVVRRRRASGVRVTRKHPAGKTAGTSG